MSEHNKELKGLDFAAGVPLSMLPEGQPVLGHLNGQAIVLVRRDTEVFAVGATCTHYSGPLVDGLVVGEELRCPWHHAQYDLRTGKAVGPPAMNPIPCYRVENRDGVIFVHEPLATKRKAMARSGPESIIIVGGGAAGNAAAETLRSDGYGGGVILIDAQDCLPVDRPNLSKDYLAGTAPEEWIPLRDREFYHDRGIELRLGMSVTSLVPEKHILALGDGMQLSYGALILATGSDPVRLPVPGAELPHVLTLRSFADSQAIINRISKARTVVLAGASFISLEVAASLRMRGIDVHLVAPESRPLERVLGSELGDFVRALHEEHGAVFHPGHTVQSIDERAVTLEDGTSLPADLVIMGVGVRPSVELAERAGLRMDGGVLVDGFMQTSAPDVYAAGDIARWPEVNTGRLIRAEHWVVAQRQGQTAARSAMGDRRRFRSIPFFWSQHYDIPIAVVGHSGAWETADVYGNLADRSCVVTYHEAGKVVAAASIFRDRESLEIEAALERDDQKAIHRILAGIRP